MNLQNYIDKIEENTRKDREELEERSLRFSELCHLLDAYPTIYKSIFERESADSDLLALAGTLIIIKDILDEYYYTINDTRNMINDTKRIVYAIADLHKDTEIEYDYSIKGNS
jgi:hypothetical protein